MYILIHLYKKRALQYQSNLPITFQIRLLCSVRSQTDEGGQSTLPNTGSSLGNAGAAKAKKISQAMRTYLERAHSHEEFMKAEIAEYEIGKRHLASIMGEDPDTFSQEDIDRAIRYLLPSNLYDKKARPLMKHPNEIIPQRKAAQFDIEGRPFHTMFYTGKPNLFQLMHDTAELVEKLQAFEDRQLSLGQHPKSEHQVQLAGSQWIVKKDLEARLQEKIADGEYLRFTKLLERLASQPYSRKEKDFIMSYRRIIPTQTMLDDVPPLKHDENGQAYTKGAGMRKRATADVRVWVKGSGNIIVNGESCLDYFPRILDRQQLLFPLQFCDVLGKVDIEISVEAGGSSGQAGAARLAIANALQSIVSLEVREKMRLAGLLSNDLRRRERKKPGQEGARRKFTWKKR